MELNLRIGSDFQIAGIASGLTFHGLIPQLTYIRIPRYEMGRAIMMTAANAIRNQSRITELPLFNTELVQGKSTQLQEAWG
jgi:DNA-binding LacI/PurR family transcriptional regulator